jgi:TolA-binding protein
METREGIALQNQILELRHELDVLRQQGVGGGYAPSVAPAYRAPPPAGGGAASGDLVAQLLDRVSALEDQVRDLRGRVDELQNAQQRTSQDLGKRIDDLAFQMQQGGGGGAPSAEPRPGAAPPSPPPGPQGSLGTVPAGPAATPRRTPELAMQQGNAALARRDYAAAEASAREVLGERGPRAYDAQFLLAQALAGQRKWQDAALAYDDTYTRSKTGSHAQDALLGLANSLTALGDKRAACGALDKLKKEFPNPRRDLHEAIAGARSRAACS